MPRKPKQLEKEYKGGLKKPIHRDEPPIPPGKVIKLLSPEIDHDAKYKEESAIFIAKSFLSLATQNIEKLGLLLEHYNIDPNDPDRWFWLSVNLAKNHVPGFKIKTKEEKGGRPQEWDIVKYARLFLEVTILMAEKKNVSGCNISRACNALLKEPEWESYSRKTLQSRYAEAKTTPFVMIYKNAVSELPDKDKDACVARAMLEPLTQTS